MAYTVNKTNGSVLTTIADGTIDNTSDLTLIGKNYSGYGEILNENLVKLMENFASSTAPTSPLAGQLWWDTSSGLLKVYNGTSMKVISGSTASATQPSGVTTGDLWWDTTNSQLKVYNGASFTTIGPSFTAGTGQSGAIVDSITDTLGSSHVVVKLFVNESLVGMISKDATFTPQVPVGGFASINPGIQLSTSISGATFRGDATNAQLLDGLDSAQFLRSDANDTTSGTLGVQNDNGITVGADNDLKIYVTGIDAKIENQREDGDIVFRVIKSVGGETNVMTLDGATGLASLQTSPTYPDSTTKIASTAFVDTNYIRRAGDSRIAGNLLPNSHLSRELGSATFAWANVYAQYFRGTAITALYADVGERFAADTSYDPGTIVALGGAAEITKVSDELSEEVFGVISEKPALRMNDGAGDDETHPFVAMTGRVPVKVVGKVKKGDRLVSAGNGLARAAKKGEANSFNTFGRSLENKNTDGEGTVTAVVTIN